MRVDDQTGAAYLFRRGEDNVYRQIRKITSSSAEPEMRLDVGFA